MGPKGLANPVSALFRTDSLPFVNEIGLSAWRRIARGLLHSRSAFGIGLPLTARVRRHLGCGCSSVVEHDLAKVGVEGSSPFARSNSLNTGNDLADSFGSQQSCVLRSGTFGGRRFAPGLTMLINWESSS